MLGHGRTQGTLRAERTRPAGYLFVGKGPSKLGRAKGRSWGCPGEQRKARGGMVQVAVETKAPYPLHARKVSAPQMIPHG